MIPKFRYWDRHEQKMYDNSQIIIWNGNAYQHDYQKIFDRLIAGKKGLVGRSLHDDYLMQSTGLKDTNGVEIFDGDLIQLFNGDVGKVSYNKILAFWEVQFNNGELNLNDIIYFGGEVIGNIYENKNLLEE